MSPIVSVIIPSYNAEKYISDAIESVLNQTMEDFELIVYDDCSTDSTYRIIEQYTDSRLKLFRNRLNSGVSETTNAAIEQAQGKYIALLDDDDIAEIDRLMLQVFYLENNPNIDILGGRTTYIDESGNVLGFMGPPRMNPQYIRAMLLFQQLDFSNGTTMMRKDFLDKHKLKYKNNYYGMQDYQFFVEASKIGNISAIDRFILRHRFHGNNLSDYEIKNHSVYRAQTYSKIQTDSFRMSGFDLSENEWAVFHSVFTEDNNKNITVDEMFDIYIILKKIIKDSRNRNLDFRFELEHFCKRKYTEILMRMNIFDIELY